MKPVPRSLLNSLRTTWRRVEKLSSVLRRLLRPPTIRDVLMSRPQLKSMMSSLTEQCVFFSPGSLDTTTSRMSPDKPDPLAADSREGEAGEEAEGRERREPS